MLNKPNLAPFRFSQLLLLARRTKLFFVLVMLAGLGYAPTALAATCTSIASGGNWNSSSTWTGCAGGTPGSGDTAIIATTGANVVSANVSITVGSVIVNSGKLTVGGSNWTVNGTTTVNSGGTIDQTNTGGTATFTGLVTVNAGGTWSNTVGETITFGGGITNYGTFNGGGGTQTFSANQTIAGGSPINFGGDVAVASNHTVTNNNTSVVTITGNLTAGNSSSKWVNGANSTLNYGGGSNPMNSGVFTASASPNTVNYIGAGQTVDATTYYNLTLGGSNTKTMQTPVTVTNDFTISSGVTVTANTSLTVGGNWTETGSFNQGTGHTVTLNGTSAQTISGTSPVAFYNLTVGTANPNITLATNVTYSNTLAGTVNLSSTCPTDYTLSKGATVYHSCTAVVTGITLLDTDPTNAATVRWTVTFSTPVTGVLASNFTLVKTGLTGTPAITGVAGSGTTWTVTASTGGGSGTLGLNQTSAGSVAPPLTGTFTGPVYNIDHIAPTVSSINLVSASPTNAASVSWTVTFSEAVANVGTGNFALVQAGGVSGATITGVSGTSPTATWTVTANTGSGSGTLGLNLGSAGTIVDTAGNALTGTFPFTGLVYTIDKTAPTVFSISFAGTSPTNAASVSWTVTFSESVNGVAASNFTLVPSGLGGAPAITGVTGPGPTATWTVTASTGTGSGTLGLDLNPANNALIVDLAGNALSTSSYSGQIYTIDKTVPTLSPVTIASNNANPALAKGGDTVTLTFTASESVKATPTVTIAGHPVTPTPAGPSRGPYTATYTMVSGDTTGVVPFTINFIDLVGNAGTQVTATTDASSVTFDKTAPTVSSINRVGATPTNAASVQWTVIFSKPVTGVDATDFALVPSTGLSGAFVAAVSGSGTTWTVTANTGIGSGNLGLNMTSAGSVIDAVGNALTVLPFTGQLYTISAIPALAEYRMDEASWNGSAGEVKDSSGSGNNAQAFNSASTDGTTPAIAGNPGTCRYGVFANGTTITNGYVNTPLPDLTTDFTVTAWMRSNSAATLGQRILVDDSGEASGYGFSFSDAGAGVLRFYSRGIAPVILDSTYAIAPNTWYFVAAVADITNKKRTIYVLDAGGTWHSTSDAAAFTGTWTADPGPVTIGGTATYHFNGNLDEVRVYQKVLSQAALAAIATQSHACPASPTVTTSAATLPTISGATLNGTVSSNLADTAVTFEYGLTTGYGSSIIATPSSVLGSNSSSTPVSAAVTGLICNTLYNFRAKGVNSVGTTNGGNLTFTTSACPSLGNVINTYYPGSTASVAAGATSILLGTATGAATPIAIGDTLIIMQMQDASINSTNTDAYGDGTAGDKVGRGATSVGGSGLYEYVIAGSNVPTGGGTLTLACGTANAYTNAAATGSAGQKTYQVIRVPVYSNATLTSTLTARAWNGSTGGVLAFDATGVLTLGSATAVSVNGMGFRGGASRILSGPVTSPPALNSDYVTLATVNNNGSKGEGIAGTPRYVFTAPSTLTNTTFEGYPSGSNGRGAPANAGGGGTDRSPTDNQENPGGGGGANGGTGGMGGIGWCGGGLPDSATFVNTAPYYGCGYSTLASTTNLGGSTGGFGGAAVAGLGATRLTLGGGGGGGTTNNGTGTLGNGLNSSGAAGGGIIMLRAGSMSGTATFNANGSDGDSSVVNDATGGGGAGGAVLISAGSGMGNVSINVKGGKGGDNQPGSGVSPHGPGGGGGGGIAITSAGTAACNNGGGSNGITDNNNVLFGAYNSTSYGSTSGGSGSCLTTLTAAQIPGTTLGATSCLHHYELSVPANSITCLPAPVTVTACADGSNPCTSVAAGVSGTANLATTGGTIGTPATITAGVATTTLSDPGAVDGTAVTVSLSSASPAAAVSCRLGSGCTTIFNTAGFIFSSSVGGGVATIPTQVAGTSSGTYYLRAVKTNDNSSHTCGAALVGANIPVNFAYECNNPTSCSSSNLMSVNGGSATIIARNNNGSVSSYASVNMNFDATGNAPLTFVYSDVGLVKLWVNKTVNAAVLTGSSNAFVVKPGGFVLSNIVRTSDSFANPAAADATGVKFVKAGEAFSATVTATTTPASGALTTRNYGKEITPEGVKLTNALVPNPGQTDNPALGGSFGSFTNGVATGTAFTWNEVGTITLTPSILSANYLGVAGDTIGTQSNVGRFYAAKFALSGGSIANRTDITGCAAGCGPFTYMGEQMSALFTLTAKAVDGTTTLLNYNWSATPANQFAKLDPLAAVTSGTGGPLGIGAVDSAATRTPFLPCGVAPAHPCLTPAPATAGTFASGMATVTVPFTIYRDTATPRGPYALLDIGVAPVDSDGAIMAAYDRDTVNVVVGTANHTWVGQTQTRYGRLKMQNMYGSERLPLDVPIQAQYYDATIGTFKLNTDDASTTLNVPSAIPPRATGAALDGTPGLYFYTVDPAFNGKNQLASANTNPTTLASPLAVGTSKLRFPMPSKRGWLDIILYVPSYLQYNWGNCDGQGVDSLMNDLPCARVTFGTYKSPLIYRRENY
jgi:hypothetical protein